MILHREKSVVIISYKYWLNWVNNVPSLAISAGPWWWDCELEKWIECWFKREENRETIIILQMRKWLRQWGLSVSKDDFAGFER